MTLRSRLLAAFGVVAIVLVIVSVMITRTTRAQLIEQVDDRLTLFAPVDRDLPWQPLPSLDRPPPGPDGVPERISDVYEGYVDADGVLTTVFAPNVGDVEYTAPDVDRADLPATGARIFTVAAVDGEVTYRVNAVRVGEVVRVTALPLDDVEDTIRDLLLVEVVGSLAILAALGLAGWWVMRLGIRPVKEMTGAATRIANGDLAERVPETAPPGTEPGDLAIALNRMLGQIEAALDERAASEDRLRRFVADASHELRTPVTTIRGYAELYRHGGLAEPAALADAMRRTEQEATRMGRLVDDMLTLAKLDEERVLARDPVDVAALARDAVSDVGVVDPGRPVTLSVDVPVGTTAFVPGDEDRLRQVFANVLGNALVHTEPGTAIDVTVTAEVAGVTVTVRDHGPGMPVDLADRATERFVRADPARTRHSGGSGLGLAIVDAAVSAHGGSVTIDTAPGAGTTIRLRFPAEPIVDTAEQPDVQPGTLPR